MAFLDHTKANFAFKSILGKAHTSDSREIANETLLSGVTSSATRVWSQAIPTSGALAVNQGIATKLTGLVLDPVSGAIISGIQVSYRLKLPGAVPSGLIGKINPLTNSVYASGDYIGNVIPEAFGIVGSSDYRPILYGNAIEIPPLDAADWFLDPYSGIITREADADSLNSWATPLTMDAYVYVGEVVSQTLQNIQSSITNISGSSSGISRTEVAAISAGLDLRTTQNTNSINTLFSTYTNSITTAAISAGLQSQINTLASTTPVITGYTLLTTTAAISAGLQSQINSINIVAGTNVVVNQNGKTWTISSVGGGSGNSWLPVQGTGISITAPTTSSYLFSVNDYISGTQVAAISSGIQSQLVGLSGTYATNQDLFNLDLDLQNQINTLASATPNVTGYTPLTTTQAISAGLQSQIVGLSGTYATNTDLLNLDLDLQNQISSISTVNVSAYPSNTDLINLDIDLQNQITNSNNSINTLFSTYTNISTTQAISAGLQSQISQITPTINNQGTFLLNTSNISFTITHSPLISLNSKFPIITLQIPSSGSNLILAAITNRTLSTFDVILSQVPNISGYYINWLLAG